MEQHIQQLIKELSDVKQQMKTMKQELNRQSQRQKDYREICNAIAAHSYCYNCHRQDYEVEHFWTKQQPDSYYNACTSPEGVKAYYVGNTKKARDRQREIVREIYGVDLKEPENVGYRVFNMLGSPYVVIAEDGQTAQGIWMEFSYKSHLDGAGKPCPNASLRKTCAEFVKEDGVWKIWRMRGMPGGFELEIPLAQRKSMEEMTEEEREYTMQEMNWAFFPFSEEEKKVLKQRFLTTEHDPMGYAPTVPYIPNDPPLPEPYESWNDDISLFHFSEEPFTLPPHMLAYEEQWKKEHGIVD